MTSAWQNLLGVMLGYFSAEGVRRLWSRRRAASITMGVHVVAVPKPIALAERQPESGDLGGFDDDHCWWGYWQGGYWLWIWDAEPVRGETHWLPASAKVLPARCRPPEVE